MLRAIGICLIVLGIALNLLNEVKGQEFASVDKNNLSFLEYTYPKDKYPDCTEPSNVELLKFSIEGIEFKWAGPNAPKNGIRYLVRYRFVIDKLTYPWNEKLVANGKSCQITDLISNSTIEIELKKLCDGKAANYTLSSEWVSVIKAELTDNNSRSQERDAEECSFITAVSAQRLSDTSYFINITTDAPEGNSFWRYMVRSKSCTSNPIYDTTFILTDTFAMINSPINGLCEIQVRIIWGGAGGTEYESWCPWLDILINGNNNPPQSPCSSGTAANPTNQNLLPSASIGDVFYVSGLPFVLSQVSGSSGTFSGQGTLSFPFGDEDLKVGFQGITVNTNKEVIAGQVTGVSSGSQPYNVGGLFNWGGHICLPKPNKEGWNSDGTWGATGLTTDPFGFDINGKYKKSPPYDGYETDDPYDENYDPNGFDANGINKFTGSKYGPNGCSRDGIDSLGRQCDPSDGKGPYWWLNGGGFSEAGKKFYSEIKDSLEFNLLALVDELIESFEDSLSVTDELCDALRDTINTQITVLGYDPEFIKGSNNEYFDPGLSRNFASRPEEIITKMARREGQEELERAHVNLYQCDLDWARYDDIIDLLNDLKNDQGNIDDFLADLKKLIENFTKEQVELYQNEEEFLNWLAKQIEEKIKRDLSGSFGYLEPDNGFDDLLDLNPKDIDLADVISASTASLDPMNLSNFDLNKEIDFQLRQGNKEIFGIHKALIYEQISIQKNFLNPVVLGGNNLMPLEFRKEILGREEIIYFDNIRFKPDTGMMDVYFVLTIPTTGQKVVFEAEDVGIASGGLLSPTKLRLLNDLEIRINNTTMLVIEGTNQGTFVEFDCHGLKEIGIGAYLEFCREFLTPLNPSTLEVDIDPSKKVKAHFGARMASWGQFMVNISVDPFAITKADDIKWVIDDATLDFSDQASPGIIFPTNYGSEFVDPNTNSPLPGWRGVSIKTLQATLPKKFSKNSNQSITIGAYDVIVDGMGFTGTVAADSVLTIEEGSIGGWGLSISHMSVDFVKNDLKGGSLEGQINVPTFTENLNYTASFHPNNEYQFIVSNAGEMTADLWAAKVTILPGSEIKVANKNDEFVVAARLNGRITVNSALGGKVFKVPNIEFQNVVISNKDPYFSPGVWSVTGSAGIKFGGFEITADSIGLFKGDAGSTETKLGFIACIKLTEESIGKIGARAKMYVEGNLTNENDRQKWNFKKLSVSSIAIDADIAGNHISGFLKFYNNHATFGNGFKGKLIARFKGLGATIDAFAQFGEVTPTDTLISPYKYFFVDAMVLLDRPIPFGALGLYGFGGGLYYKMQRPQLAELQLANWTGDDSDVGVAPSGIEYIPNPDRGIGLRATVALSAKVKEAFNCVITLELAFFAEGGLASISLDGNGRLMAPIDYGSLPIKTENTAPNEAAVSANVSFTYDFTNNEFDGDLQVFASVLGILRGSGPNNLMAWSKMHFGKGSYYIHIGTPRNPCGLVFSLPLVGELGRAESYLDIGTDLPPMISLAERGFPNLKLNNVPSKGRNSGTGFAFGSNLIFNTGEKTFLIFYASLGLELGFDIMVGKFSNVFCSNLNNAELGINGWYAQGQAWAKVSAEVGIKIKILFARLKIKIMSFSAGVGLAAKLPNPFYATGALYGKFSVLGGLVKGNCNFQFEIGEQCIPVDTTQSIDLGVILSLLPDENSDVVPVNSIPEATFYMPIERVHFERHPENPSTFVKYLVKRKKVSLTTKSGIEIPFKTIISKDGYYLWCKPIYYLPAKDTIIFEVQVDIYEEGVLATTDTRVVEFITGERPDDIPLSNILGSYPMQDMEYFYQKEYLNGYGYMVLDFGQPELFIGAQAREIVVKFAGTNQQIEVPAEYDFSSNEVKFAIPTLINNNDYILDLVDKRKSPKGDNGASDEKDDPYISKEGKVLCSFKFRTSTYNTLKEKIIDFVNNKTVTTNPTYKDVSYKSSILEPFGKQELSQGWISGAVDITSNAWYMSSPMISVYPDDDDFRDCSYLTEFYKNRLPLHTAYVIKEREIGWSLGSAGHYDWTDLYNYSQSCWTTVTKLYPEYNGKHKRFWPTLFRLTELPPVKPNSSSAILNIKYQLPAKGISSIIAVNFTNGTVK
jgi:hypothetical protein